MEGKWRVLGEVAALGTTLITLVLAIRSCVNEGPDDECPAGLVLVDGECRPPRREGCAPGLVLVEGRCQEPGCPDGTEWKNGSCEPISPPKPDDKPPPPSGLTVVSAVYGDNCGIGPRVGDITSDVQRECGGKSACDYTIGLNWNPWGRDPKPSTCPKKFTIQWRCANDELRNHYWKHTSNPQTFSIDCN